MINISFCNSDNSTIYYVLLLLRSLIKKIVPTYLFLPYVYNSGGCGKPRPHTALSFLRVTVWGVLRTSVARGILLAIMQSKSHLVPQSPPVHTMTLHSTVQSAEWSHCSHAHRHLLTKMNVNPGSWHPMPLCVSSRVVTHTWKVGPWILPHDKLFRYFIAVNRTLASWQILHLTQCKVLYHFSNSIPHKNNNNKCGISSRKMSQDKK